MEGGGSLAPESMQPMLTACCACWIPAVQSAELLRVSHLVCHGAGGVCILRGWLHAVGEWQPHHLRACRGMNVETLANLVRRKAAPCFPGMNGYGMFLVLILLCTAVHHCALSKHVQQSLQSSSYRVLPSGCSLAQCQGS